MKPVEITTADLRTECEQLIKGAKPYQMKWIYAYLHDLDDWPLVTDEVKTYKVEQD